MQDELSDVDLQYNAIEKTQQREDLQNSMSLEELAMTMPIENNYEASGEHPRGRNPFRKRSRKHSATDSIIYLLLWIVLFGCVLYFLFF